MESATTDKKGETVSPKESSDKSITNIKDYDKSDKSSTSTPKRPVTSNQDCGKSVESAVTNNSEGSVTGNQDYSMSEVEESSQDEKQSLESVCHVVLSHKLKLGPL